MQIEFLSSYSKVLIYKQADFDIHHAIYNFGEQFESQQNV